jgi:uncharacterized repeat protein (TIGR03843 family)
MPSNELGVERLRLLSTADVDIQGRMPWSSNATFLCNLSVEGHHVGQAIYKPLRGERPLWDFEPGLHKREVAAFRLSAAMGLELVPPTVLRDGPLGEGSLQWFIDADHQQHYFTIFENRDDLHEALKDFAFFDVIANNTDRKSGHVLVDADDHLWGIDHGLCFAAEFKLRTVVWEFGGQPVPDHLVAIAGAIADAPPLDVCTLLVDDEVEAMQERAQWIVEHPVFPVDNSSRRYPWPLV